MIIFFKGLCSQSFLSTKCMKCVCLDKGVQTAFIFPCSLTLSCIGMIWKMERDHRFSLTFSTDAEKAAIIITTAWLLVTIVIHTALFGKVRFGLQVISILLFILLPAINHIRMLLAIRRHNSQMVGQVGAKQLSVIFRREKKVATDMVIVVAVLVVCLAPILGINVAYNLQYHEIHAHFYSWAFIMMYLSSSINPVLYFTRNEELRSALRSVIRSCCSCC